eukprot:g35353.t1
MYAPIADPHLKVMETQIRASTLTGHILIDYRKTKNETIQARISEKMKSYLGRGQVGWSNPRQRPEGFPPELWKPLKDLATDEHSTRKEKLLRIIDWLQHRTIPQHPMTLLVHHGANAENPMQHANLFTQAHAVLSSGMGGLPGTPDCTETGASSSSSSSSSPAVATVTSPTQAQPQPQPLQPAVQAASPAAAAAASAAAATAASSAFSAPATGVPSAQPKQLSGQKRTAPSPTSVTTGIPRAYVAAVEQGVTGAAAAAAVAGYPNPNSFAPAIGAGVVAAPTGPSPQKRRRKRQKRNDGTAAGVAPAGNGGAAPASGGVVTSASSAAPADASAPSAATTGAAAKAKPAAGKARPNANVVADEGAGGEQQMPIPALPLESNQS